MTEHKKMCIALLAGGKSGEREVSLSGAAIFEKALDPQKYTIRRYDPAFDRIGYDGMEYFAEDLLAGTWGLQEVVRDVAGQIVTTIGDPQLPEPGYSLRLTIDTDLQEIAQNALFLQKALPAATVELNKEFLEKLLVLVHSGEIRTTPKH